MLPCATLTWRCAAVRRSTATARIAPGVYAFSRIERSEQVEYVVALNNSTTDQHVMFPVYLANTDYVAVWPAGDPTVTTNADAEIELHVPALSFVIYKASSALPASDAAPTVTFTKPAAGAQVSGRTELAVNLSTTQLAEVTFAVKVGEGDWQVIGTDTNPPYRVFYDTTGLAAGTALAFRAIANDLNNHLNGASTSAVVARRTDATKGRSTPSSTTTGRLATTAIRTAPTTTTSGACTCGATASIRPSRHSWQQPWPFFGKDELRRVRLGPAERSDQPVNFIVHRGDEKDPPNSPDRNFNPTQTPEIWLKQGDVAIYTSQADAQGFVTIRYHRPDGDYGDYTSNNYNDFWGLHLWTSLGGLTQWTEPKKADGIDAYGAYFIIRKADYPAVLDFSLPLNFIVHRGDVKDPENSPDRAFNPWQTPTIWLQSGDVNVYNQQGGAENFTHACTIAARPATTATIAAPTTTTSGACTPGAIRRTTSSWTSPLKPIAQDTFGVDLPG